MKCTWTGATAPSFEARQICISGYFAGLSQTLHVRDLVGGHSFPCADRPFPEVPASGIGQAEPFGNDFRSLDRPGEIAAIERGNGNPRESLGKPVHLFDAMRCDVNIDMAVVASLTAVLDLAVAHEIDLRGHVLPSGPASHPIRVL